MKTVNLELSRQLKEQGYPQEAYFWWSNAMDKPFWKLENKQFFKIDKRRDIASPTADEIMDMLPMGVKVYVGSHGRENGDINGKILYKNWVTDYHGAGIEWEQNSDKFADTMADALAKLWLYLKENNLLQKEEEG